MLLLNLVMFIVACIFLIVSSTLLVKSLGKIAKFLRIPEFSAAFIIMAFATQVPELFVGISSAIAKVPELSLGNLMGSAMLHLTLMMGIFILIGQGIKIKRSKDSKDIFYVLISILLLIILFVIGKSFSRIDGIILLLFFIFNTCRMVKERRKYKKGIRRNKKKYNLIANILLFIISITILFISANYAVKYAIQIALELNMPNIVMGLILISLATTLPELAFGVRAIKTGHEEMALGDLTGGILTNLGLVLGLVAIICPIQVKFGSFIITSIFLLISALIFLSFLKSDRELKIKEGLVLIFMYVIFIIIELLIKV